MADTASAAAAPSSATRRAVSPPGIENPNPVASTSAHTLDAAPVEGNSIPATSPTDNSDAAAATKADIQPASIEGQDAGTTAPTDQNAPISTDNASLMSASLQAATAGLNEEDAKLLTSLAEGNGLLNQLSSLAAQNGGRSDDLFNAYAGGLMLDPSTSGLPSGSAGIDAASFSGAVDLNEALTRQDMDWDDEAFDDLEPEDEDGEDQGPIQAYAKLEFPGFSYYIQTLDVTIGRRPGQLQPNVHQGAEPPQLPNAASGLSQAHITSESKTEGDVDVDLGPLKSISRLHARIFYYTGPIQPPNTAFPSGTPAQSRTSSGNGAAPYRITSPTALSRVNSAHLSSADAATQDPYNISSSMGPSASTDVEQGEGQFVLMVVGRNGAFVDDVWVEKGSLVVLGKRTKIQIAERVFYFVLPPPSGAASYSIDGDSQRAHDSESDTLSDLSSDEEAAEDEEDEEEADSSSSASSEGSEDDEYDEEDVAAEGAAYNPASGAHKGRRRSSAAANKGRADPASSEETPKRRLVLKPKSKVGKASAAAAAEDAGDDESMDVDEVDKGNAKSQGRGKAAATKTTAAALAARPAGKGKGKGKGAGRGKMPTKGPIPQTRPSGDDSDSLGTPSAGEQSEEDGDEDGISTPPPPTNVRGGAAGKRPVKGVKGLKGAKAEEAETARSAVKKESPAPSWAMGAGIAGRKRKRGEPLVDEEPALKVGTPIGIEALDAAKRAKAAKARADASHATSVSPKKDKTTASTKATPASGATPVAVEAEDDDVIMTDVKHAPPKPNATTPNTRAPAAGVTTSTPTASTPSLPAPATGTKSAKKDTAAAAKGDQKATSIEAPASSTVAKAKPAKTKTTKAKKKKGAAEETASATLAGLPGVPGGTMGSSPMALGTFPGSYGYPASMPYDPSSASAASAIIAAANAVSGSMPAYGQPPAQALPHAVGQMASPLPMAPSAAAAGRGPGSISSTGTTPGAYAAVSMAPGMTSLPAPTSTPATTSASTAPPGSEPSTWPTTASIIASAASLANAQAKQNQKPAATATGESTLGGGAQPAADASPTPAPGPEDKPDLSNIELISQALRSDHCSKKGGKLTLQEVYEWIANRWIWFKRNGRHTGRDWQSSIRHAIGSSRDFTRIPRRSDEPGKGIFYTMSNSKLAEQHRANLAKQKDEAAKAAAAAPPASVGVAGAAVPTAPGPLPSSAAAAVTNPASAAAAGAAAASTPGSLPAIRIPLIIGTPPSEATAAATDKPKAAPGTIESLLETPPIVHHDGKLYLSPQVFGHLNAGQLAQIEGLGAQQALQVLQAYLVTHLKERMRLQQVSAQKKDATATMAKPATSPATPAKAATPASSATAASSSAVSTPTAKTGATAANGSASPVKATASISMAATPAPATALSRPPGSAASLHATPTLPKPVLPAPIKPSITGGQGAAAGAKSATVASTAQSVPAPPTANAAKGAPAAATSSPANVQKAPVLPSTPLRTTAPSAAKASTPAPVAATSSPTKVNTVPPQKPAPATPSEPATPAVSTSAMPTTPAKAATPGPSTSSTPSGGTSSEDPLSALSALAAHPEAAALIALLRKQQAEGTSMAKLTSGQLQLLQMANKLAAQQGGKKKKKKQRDAGTPGPSGQESSPAPPGPSPSPGPKAT